jgi:Protein kinase domain
VTSGETATIGRYRVLGMLGEGGMGEVLRARDERLGRDVAIKRIKNVFGAMAAEFRDRFEAEARALAALTHPGVVQVYDLGIDAEAPYLVMELVDGPTLRTMLKDEGPLAAAAVRSLGIQLARALEAAHARGILHRDIKPANVLHAPGGVWKLADFGVAHMPDSEMTVTGQFMGTPAYAAPEALALGRFSPASDVFGLAATLVEAASGAKPRRDATLAELMARAHEPVTLLGIPDELRAALSAALALDPATRPSAAGLAEMLAGNPPEAVRPAVPAGVPTSDHTVALGRRAPEHRVAAAVAADPRSVAEPSALSQRSGHRHWPAAAEPMTIAVPDHTAAPAPPLPKQGPLPDSGSSSGKGIVLGANVRRAAVGMIALVAVVFVLARACTDTDRSGGSVVLPGVPLSIPEQRRDDPEHFGMPADLDRKGAQAWRDVAKAVNEGNLRKARDKMRSFEGRFGESAESARLRDWIEQTAERLGDGD